MQWQWRNQDTKPQSYLIFVEILSTREALNWGFALLQVMFLLSIPATLSAFKDKYVWDLRFRRVERVVTVTWGCFLKGNEGG